MTDGLKTSEFWLNAALILIGIFGPKYGIHVPVEVFVGSGGYAVARGIAKKPAK